MKKTHWISNNSVVLTARESRSVFDFRRRAKKQYGTSRFSETSYCSVLIVWYLAEKLPNPLRGASLSLFNDPSPHKSRTLHVERWRRSPRVGWINTSLSIMDCGVFHETLMKVYWRKTKKFSPGLRSHQITCIYM